MASIIKKIISARNAQRHEEREAELYRALIRREAKIGGEREALAPLRLEAARERGRHEVVADRRHGQPISVSFTLTITTRAAPLVSRSWILIRSPRGTVSLIRK